MDSEDYVDVPVRMLGPALTKLDRIAATACVTRDQAASVLFALWCVHNLPHDNDTPEATP